MIRHICSPQPNPTRPHIVETTMHVGRKLSNERMARNWNWKNGSKEWQQQNVSHGRSGACITFSPYPKNGVLVFKRYLQEDPHTSLHRHFAWPKSWCATCMSFESLDSGTVLASFGAAKLMILLRTSLKIEFSRNEVLNPCVGVFHGSYRALDLQESPERSPQSDPKTMVCP